MVVCSFFEAINISIPNNKISSQQHKIIMKWEAMKQKKEQPIGISKYVHIVHIATLKVLRKFCLLQFNCKCLFLKISFVLLILSNKEDRSMKSRVQRMN
jgi:redox-regulated HSP33 family molecular chaperone